MCRPLAALTVACLTSGCLVVFPVPLKQAEPLPPAPEIIAGACGAAGLQGLVGQSETVLAKMRFSQPLRVIHPGQAVTMDYSESRLNITIDAKGRIESVRCG